MVEKYSKLMRILHWLSVLLIFALVLSGAIMVDENPSDFKWQLYANHKSLGITVFALFFIRVIIRLTSYIPSLPQELSRFWQMLAKLGHASLYLLMFTVPLCGIAMTLLGGYKLSFFGIPLRFLTVTENVKYANLFNDWHVNLAWAFVWLVCLHVLGALTHLFKHKLNLFKRII